MLTAPRSLILNAVLFQVGWFACIFGARHPWLLAVALACLVALNLWWIQSQCRSAVLFKAICTKIAAEPAATDRPDGT